MLDSRFDGTLSCGCESEGEVEWEGMHLPMDVDARLFCAVSLQDGLYPFLNQHVPKMEASEGWEHGYPFHFHTLNGVAEAECAHRVSVEPQEHMGALGISAILLQFECNTLFLNKDLSADSDAPLEIGQTQTILSGTWL